MFSNIIQFCGIVTIAAWARSVYKFAWKYILLPFPPLRELYGGTWAIITGGSAGIGLEMAKILVKNGLNVVLIARDSNRLTDAARELSGLARDIEVRILSMDVMAPDYSIIMKSLENLNISLLINNVGVHNHIPTNIEDMELNDIHRIISVNCTFQIQLTSLLIPSLKKATSNSRPATIVNMSSLTSQMAMPMLSVYASSKAFEEHLTTNLAAELQPFNIDVICLRPGLTVSQMSGITEPSLFCPSSKDMAYACLRMIRSGEVSVAPYWPHAILDIINAFMPGRALTWSIVRKMHQDKRDLMLKDK